MLSLAKSIERFWDRVDKSGDCWVWTGRIDRYGYGTQPRKAWATPFAHRISWELTRGPIPDGLTIDHLCRNKRCVNPDHLEPVTREENSRRYRDSVTVCFKGHARQPHGRCPECLSEKRRRLNERRCRERLSGEAQASIRPEMHGKYSTYTNKGCRCDLCREAATAAGRRYRGAA